MTLYALFFSSPDTTRRDLSSSSSVDETLPQDPDPFDPLVMLPVAPEQRYTGGDEYQQVQHETRTKGIISSSNHTSAGEGTVSKDSSGRGSRLEEVVEGTTSTNHDTTETTTTTTTPRQDTYEHRRGRFLGRVGLEDDEDEVVAELGEFGSGSTPVDDDD